VQPPDIDIAGSHIVMGWHDQMGQLRLSGRWCRRIARRRQLSYLAHDPVGSQRGQQVELAAARGFGAPIREIGEPISPGFALGSTDSPEGEHSALMGVSRVAKTEEIQGWRHASTTLRLHYFG
jgi:hypothetical protein